VNFVDLIVFAALITVGFVAGRVAEKRHYASIRKRERQYADLLVFTNRLPPAAAEDRGAALVVGSVVVSEDYFKRVLSSLQSLFGGRIKSYESLLDRARREAVLRMKAQARERGARMIINVKFETLALAGRQPGSIGAVELLAYGTALK
jgi:uncharacterized protein YbjQ (UPF0145 family)